MLSIVFAAGLTATPAIGVGKRGPYFRARSPRSHYPERYDNRYEASKMKHQDNALHQGEVVREEDIEQCHGKSDGHRDQSSMPSLVVVCVRVV